MSQLDVRVVCKNIGKFEIFDCQLDESDVRVNALGDGLINVTALVEILNKEKARRSGISKLVYKKYGGNDAFVGARDLYKFQPPYVQSLIAYEYESRGWGPKVYGILEDVRIESFIESETLKPSDAFTDEMINDVAQAYANFHSMKVPISKEQMDLFGSFISQFDDLIATYTQWIDSGMLTDEFISRMKLRDFVSFPFMDEVKWIASIIVKIKQRKVLCTVDAQYLNRLIRKTKPTGHNMTRTVMIDYDLAAYSFRGVDLAGHFISRMLTWAGESSFVSGQSFPSEKERRKFLEVYLKRFEKLCSDFDGKGVDSIENLTLEVHVNCFAYIILILVSSRAMLPVFQADPERCSHLGMILTLHSQLKSDFQQKYPKLYANK